MSRITITPTKPIRLRYRDSIHAALVHGLRTAGAEEAAVLGPRAAPWTFAASGRSFPGGVNLVRSVILSTADAALSEAMRRIEPHHVRWTSSNGDTADFSGGTVAPDPVPLPPDAEELTVGFASPFLVSDRGAAKKGYARSLAGLDLSAAFSAGLSRRLGRAVSLDVVPDRLSALTDGARPVLVRVRRDGPRDLILPALSAIMTLRGPHRDLRDAFLAGLGEKTRYGFGCPVTLS